MQKRNATVAVIGAGDYIGGEIAKRFAREGFTVFAGRRNGVGEGRLRGTRGRKRPRQQQQCERGIFSKRHGCTLSR